MNSWVWLCVNLCVWLYENLCVWLCVKMYAYVLFNLMRVFVQECVLMNVLMYFLSSV